MGAYTFKLNPLSGKFDMVSAATNLMVFYEQTVQTTDATTKVFPSSKTTTIDTTTQFKSDIVGRGTAGELYHYQVIGTVENDNNVLALGNIVGTLYEEATVCGVDAITGHAITVSVNTTELDFEVTGTLATTIEWKIKTVFTEV